MESRTHLLVVGQFSTASGPMGVSYSDVSSLCQCRLSGDRTQTVMKPLLSFIHYMTKMHVKDRKHISQLEQYSRTILSAVSESFDLSESQKKHIQYTGACSILSVVGLEIDVYDIWMNHHYKDMEYTDIEKFKSDLAGFSPSSKILLDVFDKDNKNNVVTLTSVGQAIAIANLSTIVGKMDYSI